jgi:hypothetical protein
MGRSNGRMLFPKIDSSGQQFSRSSWEIALMDARTLI